MGEKKIVNGLILWGEFPKIEPSQQIPTYVIAAKIGIWKYIMESIPDIIKLLIIEIMADKTNIGNIAIARWLHERSSGHLELANVLT